MMLTNRCPLCGAFTSPFNTGEYDTVDCHNCGETFFLTENGDQWYYYVNNKRKKYFDYSTAKRVEEGE